MFQSSSLSLLPSTLQENTTFDTFDMFASLADAGNYQYEIHFKEPKQL